MMPKKDIFFNLSIILGAYFDVTLFNFGSEVSDLCFDLFLLAIVIAYTITRFTKLLTINGEKQMYIK